MSSLPHIARKLRQLASFQFFNIKLLLNGRGFVRFKRDYRLRGELGRGGFGVVWRAERVSDGTPVAVKFIDRRFVRDWTRINDDRVPMEIAMLMKCSHIPGVIRMLDWYAMPEGFLIVMERPAPCVDLFDFIKGQGRLDEDMCRFLFRQIVDTVLACTERRVLHRDIKDENVVVDLLTGRTRLIDFGAATVLKTAHYTDFQGTRLYCPPEWFLHSLYLGREAAVWSLGVLLYNMLNGRLPFRNEKDICTAHLLGPLAFYSPGLSDAAKSLVRACLAFDPATRIRLEDVARHPWLTASSTTAPVSWAELSQKAARAAAKLARNSPAESLPNDDDDDGPHSADDEDEGDEEGEEAPDAVLAAISPEIRRDTLHPPHRRHHNRHQRPTAQNLQQNPARTTPDAESGVGSSAGSSSSLCGGGRSSKVETLPSGPNLPTTGTSRSSSTLSDFAARWMVRHPHQPRGTDSRNPVAAPSTSTAGMEVSAKQRNKLPTTMTTANFAMTKNNVGSSATGSKKATRSQHHHDARVVVAEATARAQQVSWSIFNLTKQQSRSRPASSRRSSVH